MVKVHCSKIHLSEPCLSECTTVASTCVIHHPSSLVVTYSSLKKVGLPWQQNILHEHERIVSHEMSLKPRDTRSLSPTNSMYCPIKEAFIPRSPTSKEEAMNSFSISTAWDIIINTTLLGGLFCRWLKIRHAKSVWRPSSRKISSFENVSPGIMPRFFSQKIEAKLPEKNIPSTAAKATSQWENGNLSWIHSKAQSALRVMAGNKPLNAAVQICFGLNSEQILNQEGISLIVDILHGNEVRRSNKPLVPEPPA